MKATNGRRVDLAYRICECEFNLDQLYGRRFGEIRTRLAQGEQTHDLVTTLFILHYLERMGDSLLNIGEAVLFSIVGERMKIHQYQALTDSLSAGGLGGSIRRVKFESIWGTRSGCRIGTVSDRGEGDSEPIRPVVFKQGSLAKLFCREREHRALARNRPRPGPGGVRLSARRRRQGGHSAGVPTRLHLPGIGRQRGSDSH